MLPHSTLASTRPRPHSPPPQSFISSSPGTLGAPAGCGSCRRPLPCPFVLRSQSTYLRRPRHRGRQRSRPSSHFAPNRIRGGAGGGTPRLRRSLSSGSVSLHLPRQKIACASSPYLRTTRRSGTTGCTKSSANSSPPPPAPARPPPLPCRRHRAPADPVELRRPRPLRPEKLLAHPLDRPAPRGGAGHGNESANTPESLTGGACGRRPAPHPQGEPLYHPRAAQRRARGARAPGRLGAWARTPLGRTAPGGG